MVLNELGQKISNALSLINNAETIDEKVCIAEFRSPELQLMPCMPMLGRARQQHIVHIGAL